MKMIAFNKTQREDVSFDIGLNAAKLLNEFCPQLNCVLKNDFQVDAKNGDKFPAMISAIGKLYLS